MTSIRFRLFVLLSLFAGTTFTLSWVTYQSFKQMMDSRRQLELSYTIRDEIQDLASLKASTDLFRRMQSYRARLQPERRKDEFSSLIQSVNEGNPDLCASDTRPSSKMKSNFNASCVNS